MVLDVAGSDHIRAKTPLRVELLTALLVDCNFPNLRCMGITYTIRLSMKCGVVFLCRRNGDRLLQHTNRIFCHDRTLAITGIYIVEVGKVLAIVLTNGQVTPSTVTEDIKLFPARSLVTCTEAALGIVEQHVGIALAVDNGRRPHLRAP